MKDWTKKTMTRWQRELFEQLLGAFCDSCRKGYRVLWDDHHKTWYHPDVEWVQGADRPCEPGSNIVREGVKKVYGEQVARSLCRKN